LERVVYCHNLPSLRERERERERQKEREVEGGRERMRKGER
jgi:hypothetical protein